MNISAFKPILTNHWAKTALNWQLYSDLLSFPRHIRLELSHFSTRMILEHTKKEHSSHQRLIAYALFDCFMVSGGMSGKPFKSSETTERMTMKSLLIFKLNGDARNPKDFLTKLVWFVNKGQQSSKTHKQLDFWKYNL